MGTRAYFKIPPVGAGTAGANFLAISYAYDIMGRKIRTVDASETILRTVYHPRSFVVSNWIGTNDREATDSDPTGGGADGNNMRMISSMEYDDGEDGGDGNLTEMTQPVDANSANDRITSYGYDFRDRPETVTQTDGTTIWIAKTTYDNLDRVLQMTRYHTSVSNGNRIAQRRTFYDKLGHVFRVEADGIDISDGSVVNTLVAQNWYDLAGNTIKWSQMGSTGFTKAVYDALNRIVESYLACVPGTAGVPSGDDNDVSDDTVIEQDETGYDRGGNVILQTSRKRFDDATGAGPLKNVALEPKARVSYLARWPDAIGRTRNVADYGTNGGKLLTRPQIAPARSDTVLVTTTRYKDTGDSNAIVDPMGLEIRWENDQLGRRIRLIENFVENSPRAARISEYIWHGSGQLERLTLVNADTGDQATTWVYGTTLFNSAVASNSLLRTKIFPESEDRPPPNLALGTAYCRQEFSYNRQSQKIEFTDADDTVHQYTYDKLGRLLDDKVTTLAVGLDGTVRRIVRAYEVRGMLLSVTSYNAASAGSIVNQVVLDYDAFSNLVKDQQSHAGAVGGGTPRVEYGYSDGSNNTMRRTSVTYPDGRVLTYLYGSANSVNDHFNRITAEEVAGEGASLVEYTYCGLGWQVRVGYPEPAVELTYRKQGTEPVGDSGDPYNGYDRFGRTQDIRWQTIA